MHAPQQDSAIYNGWLIARSTLFYTLLVPFTILWCSAALVYGPFLNFEQRSRIIIALWCRTVMVLLRWCCGIRYEVQGADNIRPGSILYSKHESTWETFFIQTLIQPQTQVIKQELLNVPFFGWAFTLVNPIAIDRSDRKKAMAQLMAQGTERLNAGISLMIFPEGTRVDPGQYKPFTKGGARLAIAAGKPLVPIAHNAGDYWPNGRLIKYPGTIRMVIGQPISPKGQDEDSLTRIAERWVLETTARLHEDSWRGEPVFDKTIA